LTDAELGGLNELATHRNQRLAQCLVAEALRSGTGTRKLRVRSALALPAVVGLDAGKRRDVEEQPMRALEDPEVGDEVGTDVALSAAALGGPPPSATAVVARTLLQAIERTNEPPTLELLVRNLSAVAARLEPRDASQAAAALMLPMTRTEDYLVLTALKDGLAALLGNGRRLERARSVTTTVGSLHQGQGLPGALVLLQPAAEPFSRRFSDQELEEPLCVGPARRAVLDQLEEHQRGSSPIRGTSCATRGKRSSAWTSPVRRGAPAGEHQPRTRLVPKLPAEALNNPG
jgi:hypothetical protein